MSAAREAFLDGGYGKTSMDSIAKAAEVGIKTLYRHFENKDDLFNAVMQAACNPEAFDEVTGEWRKQADEPDRAWFSKPPRTALVAAGIEYLQHVLSEEQLDLYRVVTQDAHRFPELGRRYREQVVERSYEVFLGYLNLWSSGESWKIRDKRGAALTFAALLRAGIFEEVLHGLRKFSDSEIAAHARRSAASMLVLLNSGSC